MQKHISILIGLMLVTCSNSELHALDKVQTISMEDDIASITYSADGKYLLVSTYEDGSTIYSLKRRKTIRLQEPHMYISFSPNARYLCAIDQSGRAYNVYDVDKGTLHHSISNDTKTNIFSFGPSGKYAAVSFRDKIVRFIDLDAKKRINTITHKQNIKFADFTADGKYLISASWQDNIVAVYSIKDDKVVKAFTAPAKSDIRMSANGRFVILGPSGDKKGIISIVDLKDMTQKQLDADDELPVLYLTPDSRYLVITEKQMRQPATLKNAKGSATLGNLPERLATTVTFYNLETEQINEIFTGIGWHVCSFSKNGRYLLLHVSIESANEFDLEARIARLFDLNTLNETWSLKHTKKITDARFSPDGKSLITASDDKIVRIANVAVGNTTHKIICVKRPVSAFFSPDSKLVVMGMDDGTTEIYDPKSKRIIQSYKLGSTGMFGLSLTEQVEFSPDGDYYSILEKSNSIGVYRVTDE